MTQSNASFHSMQRQVIGASGPLGIHLDGDESAPTVVMTHSILSSSMMWDAQVPLLTARGFRVVRIDFRGHGASPASAAPYTMDALGDDVVAVLDTLAVSRAHYVGLSLGGMVGFGLGIRHAKRLLSLCLCDARADSPPAAAAPWDDRIAVVLENASCAPLALPTLERWFGKPFLASHPEIGARFVHAASTTHVEGFIGCARAIQGMHYLSDVKRINLPTTLVAGADDGVIPEAMRALQAQIPGALLEIVANAGHLPNIDQPQAFAAALQRHLERVTRH